MIYIRFGYLPYTQISKINLLNILKDKKYTIIIFDKYTYAILIEINEESYFVCVNSDNRHFLSRIRKRAVYTHYKIYLSFSMWHSKDEIFKFLVYFGRMIPEYNALTYNDLFIAVNMINSTLIGNVKFAISRDRDLYELYTIFNK